MQTPLSFLTPPVTDMPSTTTSESWMCIIIPLPCTVGRPLYHTFHTEPHFRTEKRKMKLGILSLLPLCSLLTRYLKISPLPGVVLEGNVRSGRHSNRPVRIKQLFIAGGGCKSRTPSPELLRVAENSFEN